MNWLKWHVGTVNDPKFTVIARRVGQPKAIVLAVWAALLETACNDVKRGNVSSFDAEDVGAALDLEPEVVEAIFAAIKARGMVTEDMQVAAWERRQFGDYSTDRVRKFRAKKAAERNESEADETDETRFIVSETPCNVDKKREDKNIYSVPSERTAEPSPKTPQELEREFWLSAKRFLVERGITERRTGSLIGKWLKAIGPPDAQVQLLRVLASAEANCRGDVIEYIEGAIRRLKHEKSGGIGGKQRLSADEQRRADRAAIIDVLGADIQGRRGEGAGIDRGEAPAGFA